VGPAEQSYDRIAGHKYDVAYDNALVVKGP
jgi:hypothetical protein